MFIVLLDLLIICVLLYVGYRICLRFVMWIKGYNRYEAEEYIMNYIRGDGEYQLYEDPDYINRIVTLVQLYLGENEYSRFIRLLQICSNRSEIITYGCHSGLDYIAVFIPTNSKIETLRNGIISITKQYLNQHKIRDQMLVNIKNIDMEISFLEIRYARHSSQWETLQIGLKNEASLEGSSEHVLMDDAEDDIYE